ncbi:MAG: SpoIID/LytB domain-containing protein [Elusimicrobiota bacterium]|nr:SpoIID/LytB domain-containing protein [Elusimicrobiota bacterium]
MSIQVLLIFLLNILTQHYGFCDSYEIRVGIATDVQRFQVGSDGKEKLIIKTSKNKIKTTTIKQPVTVSYVKQGKIKLLEEIYYLPVKFTSEEGKIQVNNRIYPGEIEVILSTKGVTIVNIIDIERYLYGVVPYEISQNWTDEMLEVQSIIARTYALLNLNRHQGEGFDLCAEVHCQVYKGYSKTIHTRVKKAVDSTEGLVVVDEDTNKLVQTYYHAACGGGTENVIDVWSGGLEKKHLIGVNCNFCDSSPYRSWRYEISQSKFVKLLAENNIFVGKTVKKIKVLKTTKKGRAKEVEVVGDTSSAVLRGEDLRRMIGYNNLRSTKIKNIEVNKESIVFYGKGWGHGVGLCQWGANYLAQKGYKFDTIIKHYYPHTRIYKIH